MPTSHRKGHDEQTRLSGLIRGLEPPSYGITSRDIWIMNFMQLMLRGHAAAPLETEEKAKPHREAVDNPIEVTTPTDSKPKVESSPCGSAQQRVREETERIKNSYDHDIKKRERGLGFSVPPLTPLGEAYLMPRQYREINKAITEAYSKLVADAPYLPWAKVGHIVTAQFGCNMQTMLVAADSSEAYTSPLSYEPLLGGERIANDFDDAIRAIGEGNIRIFDALYPTMRLVADLGPEKFLDCAKNGHLDDSIPDELISAIEKLQEGDFEKAEYMIVDYEQREIAPPIYHEFKQQYEFMQSLSSLVGGQSVLPVTHCTFIPGRAWKDIAPVSMDGSLFNEDDRVEFYKKLAPFVKEHYGR